ncbi:hypothetical protein ACN28I_44855 [Archangium gephyra]|uniref:hypothetical protein n=1 Tax=Archangium gephyra TaxID=48 RepID=UPI003B768F0C
MTSALSLCRWLCLAALVSLVGPGCFVSEQCDFSSRCVGESQYEWCNVGSDFEAHRSPRECKAPNAACVQTDEDSVQCVYAPAAACDASFVDRCEGTRRVYCDERLGWVQAVDCVTLGSAGCHVDAALGKAVCD